MTKNKIADPALPKKVAEDESTLAKGRTDTIDEVTEEEKGIIIRDRRETTIEITITEDTDANIASIGMKGSEGTTTVTASGDKDPGLGSAVTGITGTKGGAITIGIEIIIVRGRHEEEVAGVGTNITTEEAANTTAVIRNGRRSTTDRETENWCRSVS